MKVSLPSNPFPASALQPQAATQAAAQTNDKKALKKSCQELEGIFIKSMYSAMRKTLPKNGLFGKSNAMDIFQDMLDQEVATQTARKQSKGLADQMYGQMEKKLPSGK